jgi:hypothetical protein
MLKRKIFVAGIAIMSGLPQAVLAKSADEDSMLQAARSFWSGASMLRYSSEVATHSLMEHMVTSVGVRNSGHKKWRLEYSVPQATLDGGPELPEDMDTRMGFTMKLSF